MSPSAPSGFFYAVRARFQKLHPGLRLLGFAASAFFISWAWTVLDRGEYLTALILTGLFVLLGLLALFGWTVFPKYRWFSLGIKIAAAAMFLGVGVYSGMIILKDKGDKPWTSLFKEVRQVPAPIVVANPSPIVPPSPNPTMTPSPTVLPTPRTQRTRKKRSAGLTAEEKWILRQLNSNKNAHASAPQGKQITKEELKSILRRKLTTRGMDFLAEQVRQRGVSFSLTPEIEQELRDHGRRHGNESINALISIIRDLEFRSRVRDILSKVPPAPSPTPIATPIPKPSPTPDWKESEEAKQIANQLMDKVEKLMDEGKAIDLTKFDQAIKVYHDWVEKCSVSLGQIDSALRRFGQNTSFKFKWDQPDRTIRKSKYVDEADQKRMFKLELNSSILILQIIKREIALATLPDLNTPATVPLSVAFIYREKQIQIHNLTDTEFYLWGSKLGSGPVKMEQEPRVVSPEPFFYHIYGFDELALKQMSEGSESRTVYYLFVEDHRRQKYTLRCLLWARKKDRELTVETQNLGTVEGWIQ